MTVVLAFVKEITTYLAIVAGALGAIAGCVAAVTWGITTIGLVPISLIGTFVLGCILTAALIHARVGAIAVAGRERERRG